MKRPPGKQTALVGALVGVGVGLLLLSGADPSDSATNDSYRGGMKLGFVARYAVLGALAAVLATRILSPGEGARNTTIGLYLAGLLVVLGLAVLPPVLDEETPEERRKAEAVRADTPQAEFRAGAINGCVDSVRRRFGVEAQQAGLDVDAYCECLIDRLMAEGQRRGVSLPALGAQIRSSQGPPWAERAAKECGARASG